MKILLTGLTGYIGKRLIPSLLGQGYKIVCLVRDTRRVDKSISEHKNITLIKADLLNPKSLTDIPDDIDAAYYFVHSMSSSGKDFYEPEENSAKNFVEALDKTKAKQIIYLSGIINEESELSTHLSSRLNVERILKSAKAKTTILRAAIIIGSGSGSFEIIRDLTEKLPVMIAPKWLKTKCQPIAIRNVIEYLLLSLNNPETFDKTFDIGGPDILTYKEMLQKYAKVRGLKRLIITVPVLTPRLSSYWLYFVTSTNFSLAKSLVQSMRNEVVCKNKLSLSTGPELIGYEDSIKKAFSKINSNNVLSSWIDSAVTGNLEQNFLDKIEVPMFGCLADQREMKIKSNFESVKNRVWEIGGEKGWYYWNWAWVLRGLVDKIVGGVGLRRGRRSSNDLRVGDALDWWRVLLADRIEGRLILYAEMKLPGEAWLEFRIDKLNNKLLQKATFRPNGVIGRIYWYLLLPIHKIIFNGMAKKIV